MPFLYIYSPSDFVSTPPNEHFAAVGSPPFTLELKPGATGTRVEVTDDDAIFDEVDGQQELTNSIDLDGTAYAAGTSIHTSYDLINTTSGHKVSGVHLGGDGNAGGAVQGIVSSVPLDPGVSYTFNSNRTSHNKNNPYDGYVSCFVAGTLIDTGDGPVPIETLRAGDMIRTYEGALHPLRLLLQRHLSGRALQANPKLRPIRISASALGGGKPERTLRVSPQHRMVCNSPIADRMFDTPQVLVSAINLTLLPGVSVDEMAGKTSYFHLVMDRHEIIFAEGAPTESFYCGPIAMAGLDPEALAEMTVLFPDLVLGSTHQAPKPALPIPVGKKQKRLIERHRKNNKALVRA